MLSLALRLKRSRIRWPSEPAPGDEDVRCRPRPIRMQVVDRFRAQCRIGDQHETVGRNHDDVGEILQRIVADVGIDGGTGEMRAGAGIDERIAVRLGACDLRRADRAARARAVLDNELLAEGRGELGRQQPGQLVGAAARRKRHDDPHRLGGRPLLGAGVRRSRPRQTNAPIVAHTRFMPAVPDSLPFRGGILRSERHQGHAAIRPRLPWHNTMRARSL